MKTKRYSAKLVAVVFIFLLSLNVVVFLPYAKADDTNIGAIPDYWLIGDSLVAPTYLDTTMTHNGNPSVRMEYGDGSKLREIWQKEPGHANHTEISPSDHVQMGMWMRTNTSTVGCTHTAAGIRFGIDFYTENMERITGVQSPDGSYWTEEYGFPENQYEMYVNWTSDDWEYREMNFTVPSQYPADPFSSFEEGTLVTPYFIVPWVQVWCDTHEDADQGVAWFSDAELYINPTGEGGDYIFEDGFESNDFSEWNDTSGTISVVDTASHHGDYSAKVNASSSGYAEIDLPSAQSVLHARKFIRFDSLATDQWTLHTTMKFFAVSGDAMLLKIIKYDQPNSNYTFQLGGLEGDDIVTNDSDDVTIDPEHWYCLEVRAVIDDSNGEYMLWLDEQLLVNVTGKDTNNRGNILNVSMGLLEATAGVDTLHFDCVVISDSYIGLETFTLSLFFNSPTNTTYTTSTVNYDVVAYGNDTNPQYQINAYLDGVPVGTNQTATSGSFTELGNGTYVFACYVSGDNSASDYQEVVFSVEIITDTTAPAYSNLTTSTTAAGATCNFNITVTDNIDLSHYIFSTNNTGLWSNDTTMAFSTNPQTVSASKTLNSTIGTVVQYQWLFNDTANNWNSTSIQSLTITDSTNPSFSTITGNTTYANKAVSYTCTISDNIAVSGFIASWNNSGSWVNGTWTSGSSGTLTGTHNSIVGAKISVRFYANDTTNNWATSSITTFTLTDGTAPTSSGISSSSTTAGSTCTFAVTVTDETSLGYWIFGTNNTGSWVNATTTAFSSNPETINVNQVLSGVVGRIVGYQWFYHDSSNNWGYSSIYTLTITEVSLGGGGSAGEDTTPTTIPYQTPSTLGAVDFQVDSIDMGTVNPNSTVKAQLHFSFSGSSYKLQSIVFSETFNSLYVHDASFTTATYIITNNGQGEGTVNLTFNIPADIPVQRFTGGFQVSAVDAFGGEHKSNGEITLIVAGAQEDFLYFLRENPIYMLFIAIAVILVLLFIVVFSKRR